jgi:tRNA (guanine37-N1)-methyltransferase
MIFHVLTLFPNTVNCFIQESIVRKSIDRGIVKVSVIDIRDFSTDKHKSVDDYPFGGGSGMLMSAAPIFSAVESIPNRGLVIYLSPMGAVLQQKRIRELAKEEALTVLCGHYEGIDHRVVEQLVDEEISVGDYVLTCGEIGAAVLIDAITRELEGALGNNESKVEESFDSTGLLEYEQYTRPAVFRDHSVPDVLLSGNHNEIRKWKMKRRILNTLQRRPDLLDFSVLSAEYKKILQEVIEENNP